ncbi:HAMP domain-containing sensor histidine kinase [Bacillus sp. DTU_2020_1000418_1_SI_GHA_SEK_038]|uniref:HAMP domain-containing sensor histidine kinase n=1 Tax=Bacillus sp. DTU_2020_1000418_1_SI_GHA_SEK_038 TaxID=3077585 RepID=UPI0028EA803E|nr:HAMP domain-containing sensor histidine kinase [Bacillus sp. DTU_2020_1000418_1_SI_GHA_SEK_038]WNS76724.1 HAMP domain-containing sensor histidine kinase [Bacillus sp. DTU_2020_1000418_1_SI_GHA_SEK_038]
MRIRFFYQLLISHISILILAFLILSLSFSQFVERYIFQNKVEELEAYGDQILTDLTLRLEGNEQFLAEYSQLLNTRHIKYILFNYEGKVIYPKLQSTPLIQLTEKEWTEISKGNKVSVKHDIKRFGQEVSLVAVPFMQGDRLGGGILLLSPITGTMNMIAQLNKFLLYTIVISLSASILISLVFSKSLIRRIKEIRNATSMISAGNYDVHVPESSIDEIGQLARDFNEMAGKIKESHEEIERLENRRRKFIADVSHEMRTPLTTISGLAEGIKNQLIPEDDIERGMVLIDREAKRLIRLVNENLDYEKIRSNQLKLDSVEINLSEVLEVVKEQLQMQALEKNNHILVICEAGITVIADYDRLIQILINIVKNSNQFTESGQIILKGLAEKKETIIEIEDTGIGIDPEEIESIWHRFYKADVSRTGESFGEFGIGLSIVKQLVQLHHGRIEVSSEKGKGTKFTIYFPKG